MKELIQALHIFFKYIPECKYPTGCEHDEFRVYCNPELVSEEDAIELEKLGFDPEDEFECFRSSKYGSC